MHNKIPPFKIKEINESIEKDTVLSLVILELHPNELVWGFELRSDCPKASALPIEERPSQNRA